MPRYHLHLCEGPDCIPDEEGLELPDLAAAIACAERGLKELLCDDVRAGNVDLHRRVEVEDDRGRKLAQVIAADLIRVHAPA